MTDVRKKAADVQREYYRAHAKKINARRRERYDSDPEYKDRVLAQQREAYAKRMKERPPRTERSPRSPQKYNLPGLGEIVMLTIAQFADAIGYAKNTVLKWEQLGVIPVAVFRTPGGARLYSQAQVDAVKKLLTPYRGRKVRDWDKTTFPRKVKEAWAKLEEERNARAKKGA